MFRLHLPENMVIESSIRLTEVLGYWNQNNQLISGSGHTVRNINHVLFTHTQHMYLNICSFLWTKVMPLVNDVVWQ
jgi:hypothetical protein